MQPAFTRNLDESYHSLQLQQLRRALVNLLVTSMYKLTINFYNYCFDIN